MTDKFIKLKKDIDFISNFQLKTFGMTVPDALKENVCINCKAKVEQFKDELSKKEYKISAYCQSCQDSIFDVLRQFEKGS